MRIVPIFLLSLTCIAPAAAAAEDAGPDCGTHSLQAEQVREQLRQWSGLAAFASWKLIEVKLGSCVREEQTLAQLQIAPPAKWSTHDLPYRVWLTIPVEADSGQAATAAPEVWKDLARGVKRLIGRAERYEDMRRFIERFGVARAELDATPEPGRYRVTYFAGVLPDQTQPRVPSITYDESAPGRITAYRIPHMDSLPVRRELLRILELLSARHPRCVPVWIDARQTGSAIPGQDPLRWTFALDLRGDACPAAFAARLDTDGARQLSHPVLTDDGGPGLAKGDDGGAP